MREAIAEAKKAEGLAEVPIGAVIVRQGEIIGRGHNLKKHGKKQRRMQKCMQSKKRVADRKLASRRNPIICNFRALSNV